jgi:uncharacterized DUF497 family protein
MAFGREFEWDEPKARQNLAKHGVRFDIAVQVFSDPDWVDSDVSRAPDRESRRKAVGRIGRKLYAVIYTHRGSLTRIISARRTNTQENRIYDSIHT